MLKPTGKRVLVTKKAVEQKTQGGIILPESVKEEAKDTTGEVVAVGPKAEGIKVGDVVLFGEFAGTDVRLDGKEYLLMPDEDVLAIF
ncbi:co-chaperone GroES [Candidatus Pacearchaeota archaeon]|nr:co-chaperone GroES [Candidatus Pacearchaeota archaeon]